MITNSSFTTVASINKTEGMHSQSWLYRSLGECLDALGDEAYPPIDDSAIYCNGTWDRVLCWPATPAGRTVKLSCPKIRALDPSKFGYKKCGVDGRWEGKTPGDFSVIQGWTNYSQCYTKEAKKIYDKIFGNSNTLLMRNIANGARIMEMVGLSLSFVLLIISIFIFCYFRTLRCHRTRIHRNLFVAILVHTTIQLSTHVDQFVSRTFGGEVGGVMISSLGTIYNTPVLCEILITLVEYSKTSMFMWMLVEGTYLHNTLVVSVFSGKPNYAVYYTMGWGIPVPITLVWVVTNYVISTGNTECFFGYTYKGYYWIIEAPRALVIMVNLIFLLNIIRVLVTKLRKTHSTEAVQAKKAVKAAIVLLPLLGFNNFMEIIEAPLDTPVKFAIWSYASHFLISFQGCTISLLYCFFNGEVQHTIRMEWERRRDVESMNRCRATSRTLSVTMTEMPRNRDHLNNHCDNRQPLRSTGDWSA